MIPNFSGQSRPRNINLGGSSSTASQATILDQVKAQREQRLELKRRQENALKIQAWWRGTSEARQVRRRIRQAFDEEDGSATVAWTRYLVLGWSGSSEDWERLGRWSACMSHGMRRGYPRCDKELSFHDYRDIIRTLLVPGKR